MEPGGPNQYAGSSVLNIPVACRLQEGRGMDSLTTVFRTRCLRYILEVFVEVGPHSNVEPDGGTG